MKKINVRNVSSLEKILPGTELNAAEINEASCLKGERFSYQIALMGNTPMQLCKRLDIAIKSELEEKIKIYEVDNVAVNMPVYIEHCDNRYITRQAAVIPDILSDNDGTVSVPTNTFKVLWVCIDADVVPGSYEIVISFNDGDEVYGESRFSLKVIDAVLPKQSLVFTEWFHSDCLSSYYGVEPLSEEHWRYIEKFLKTAVDNGINMILTPVFTLPLDTKIGAERPTVQLVDVSCDDGKYNFNFDKLLRWLDVCRKVGVEYIEISHLFSQWGAKCAPKIVVEQNGKLEKKFGWHTESESEEYKAFLAQFLPRLTEFIRENWDSSKVYFHLSDEPGESCVERYGRLYEFVKPFIADFKLIDAMSEYEIYNKGYVDTPVVTIGNIHEFIDNNVENLWGYYCCGEGDRNLSNRFIAMPSYRTRMIGTQLYKYKVKGFLHWGYNFYYSQYSTKLINPYITNDADGAFPAGDAFSVYPGAQGPVPSIRLYVFYEALQDIRAFELLESLAGREAVIGLIDECGEITFNDYPGNGQYLSELRQKVNKMIDLIVNKDK